MLVNWLLKILQGRNPPKKTNHVIRKLGLSVFREERKTRNALIRGQ